MTKSKKNNPTKKRTTRSTSKIKEIPSTPKQQVTKKSPREKKNDSSTDNLNNKEIENSSLANDKTSKKTLFRIFFPLQKNKHYPKTYDCELAKEFKKLNQPLPNDYEVDILSQLFDIDSVYKFKEIVNCKDSNKDMQQILFVKKYLRTITNLYHDQIQFWVVDETTDIVLDENGQVKSKTIHFSLNMLNETEAICRIKKHLKNKASKLPTEKSVVKTDPFKEIKSSTIASFKMLYNDSDLLKHPNKTDYYSLIHSTCEEFDFIVYDQSHKLKKDVPIHQCLKIRLSFPPAQNMFIIFNGHTAHCGAAAIEERGLHSFSFQNSLRLFAYVSKSGGSTNTEQKRNTRRNTNISNQEAYKKVDKFYSKTCELPCKACNPTKLWYHFGTLGLGHYRLNLNDCFNFKTNYGKKVKKTASDMKIKGEKKQTSNPNKKQKLYDTKKSESDKPILIAGDLEVHGWAVYAGVDISSVEHFGVINELEKIINKQGNKTKWKTIDNSKDSVTHNLGERTMLTFNDISGKGEKNFKQTNTYLESVEKIVRNIPKFKEALLKRHSFGVLRNEGNVCEQYVHRDETTIEDDTQVKDKTNSKKTKNKND